MFPASISFVVCPADFQNANKYIEQVASSISKVDSRLFSRSIDIPCYLMSTEDDLRRLPDQDVEKSIVVVFSSINVTGDMALSEAFGSVLEKDCLVVPVSLDQNGFNISERFSRKNFIRSFNLGVDETVLWILNEIYGLLVGDGSDKINIFLSHAKADDYAVKYAEEFKRFIDDSSLSCFFDSCDIPPGNDFEKEIFSGLENASVLVFNSDSYTASYWCQREIITAKTLERPVVVLDCLRVFQDRLLPATTNVPCHHIAPGDLSEEKLIQVLTTLVAETIRVSYFKIVAEYFKREGLLASNADVVVRPPEVRTVLKYKSQGAEVLCYPDPPLYEDEVSWVAQIGIKVCTPVTGICADKLRNKVFTFSISDPEEPRVHYLENLLTALSKKLVKYLYGAGSIIQYGGDFRKEGFTEYMLEELKISSSKRSDNNMKLNVYCLAGRAKDEFYPFYSTYKSLINVEEIEAVELANSDASYKFQLLNMRREIMEKSDFLVVAGGKCEGYAGFLPGILEEVLCAFYIDLPVYIYSSYGGVSDVIYRFLIGCEESRGKLTDYFSSVLASPDVKCSSEMMNLYSDMVDKFLSVNISYVSHICSLASSEYSKMSCSRISDVNVAYMLKGAKGVGCAG